MSPGHLRHVSLTCVPHGSHCLPFTFARYRGLLIHCLPFGKCLSPISQGRVHVGLALGQVLVAVLMASTIPEVGQICHVLVTAAAALCFYFCQPYYRSFINGTVVGCLSATSLTSVLAFLVLVIPVSSVKDLLGWLCIPVFLLVIPAGMWANQLRFVKLRPVSSRVCQARLLPGPRAHVISARASVAAAFNKALPPPPPCNPPPHPGDRHLAQKAYEIRGAEENFS